MKTLVYKNLFTFCAIHLLFSLTAQKNTSFVIVNTPFKTLTEIDSISTLLKTMPKTVDKVHLLLKLGKSYGHLNPNVELMNPDSSLFYNKSGFQMAKEIGDFESQAIACMNLHFYYGESEDYEKAVEWAYRGVNISKEKDYPVVLSKLYNSIGHMHLVTSKPDSAYHYLSLAVATNKVANTPENNFMVYQAMGDLFVSTGEYQKAEQYFKEAQQLAVESNHRFKLIFSLHMLAEFYSKTNQLEAYSEIFEEYLKMSNAMNKGARNRPLHMTIFQETHGDDNTLDKLEKSLEVHAKKGKSRSMTLTYWHIGQIRHKRKEYGLALKALQDGIELLDSTYHTKLLADFYYASYESSKGNANYPQSLKYLESYQVLNDSLKRDEAEQNLAELEVRYETDKKEQALKVQTLELGQKTVQRNIFLVSSTLFGLLAFAIFWGYRNRIRINKKIAGQKAALQKQKINELQQEKKLLALQSMFEGQESERARIAKDLHDGLGGLLSTVKAHFNALHYNKINTNTQNLFSKTNGLIDEACVEVRRISHNMMPYALSISGLEGALQDLAEHMERQGINCRLEIIGLDEKMEQSRSVMIYRILQELINNILKHATATLVLIQLMQLEKELHILVEDDGKGFQVEAALQQKGIGLKSIESRVKYLQGDVIFDSVKGEGTTVNISLPV